MRWALAAFALLFGAVAMPAAAQTPAPGCRPPPPAELVGQAADLDYELTDTAGLNVVLVHLFGPTTLSDRSCLPDPEQGALQVVANYGVSTDAPPEEHAREVVFGTLARSHPDRRPAEFPSISVETLNVNAMPGAEAFSLDETEGGAAVFRYALVFVFPDGAKGFLSASGPRNQFETLRPSLRRIAVGLRARRDAAGMQQDLIGAAEGALARLRGPVLDQALDACLTATYTTDGVISRATAGGFPAFEEQQSQWRVSEAPANDSGRITLGVKEVPSNMLPNRRAVTCVIGAASGFSSLFRERFDARFQGAGEERFFTVSNGAPAPMTGGGIQVGPGGGIGRASLRTVEGVATITIEITGLN